MIHARSDLSSARKKARRSGAAALEYLIVSTCAGALALGALAFVGRIYKARFDQMLERFHLDGSEEIDIPDDPLVW